MILWLTDCFTRFFIREMIQIQETAGFFIFQLVFYFENGIFQNMKATFEKYVVCKKKKRSN